MKIHTVYLYATKILNFWSKKKYNKSKIIQNYMDLINLVPTNKWESLYNICVEYLEIYFNINGYIGYLILLHINFIFMHMQQ